MQERVGTAARGYTTHVTTELGRRVDEALQGARDVDDVATRAFATLIGQPEVHRVKFALAEGGGRRLRQLASDQLGADTLHWVHVDAYDDVPLTHVVRTGETVMGALDDLVERFPGLPEEPPAKDSVAIAAVPLPGTGSPIGGLLLWFDSPQDFHDAFAEALREAGAMMSLAVRRLRLTVGRHGADAVPAEPEIPEGALTAALLLESDPRASSAARRFLRQQAAEWGLSDDLVDTAQLCLSELVTNAVVHAGTASELRAIVEGGVLTVFVRDLGGLGGAKGEEPHPSEDPDPLRVFGRGLMLVDALADRWGSERDVTGTTVWFALDGDRG